MEKIIYHKKSGAIFPETDSEYTLYEGFNLKDHLDVLNKRVSLLEGTNDDVTIPSYWEDYIIEKETEIKKGFLPSDDRDAFAFITDLHYGSYNYKNSASLASHILHNTGIDKIIIGGDLVNGYTSKEVDRQDIQSFLSALTLRENDKLFPIRGNHDAWKQTEAEYYEVMMGNASSFAYCQQGIMYYYYDNIKTKIRYIFLDNIYAEPSFSDPSSHDMMSNTQKEWFRGKITELTSDWSVVVFTHGLFTAEKSHSNALNPYGVDFIGFLDSIYNNISAKIIGIIVGHCHRDISYMSNKGYLVISTTCDANGTMAQWDIDNPNRVSGTTSEQAFDVFVVNKNTKTIKIVRVGAGEDRVFNYQ